MKRIFSVLIAVVLVFCLTIPTLAQTVSKDDYTANYNTYKEYYNNTYVPSYNNYNQKLNELAAKIAATDFTTVEQAQRVIDFLTELKTAKTNFFGTRDTVGKSRYVVPTLRDQMFAKAAEGDFVAAIDLCTELKSAVVQRVSFLDDKASAIGSFQIIVPQAAVSVQFKAPTYGQWYMEFDIVITNNSNADITAWSLNFDHTGKINTIWNPSPGYSYDGTLATGGALAVKLTNGHVTLSPSNKWQPGYLIPAHTSITLKGHGAAINSVSNATINGISTDFSFIN